MLLHNLYINVTIAHILVYRKCLYDLPEPTYDFSDILAKKSVFADFLEKTSCLTHMLLHNLYINMALAHILLYRKSLYDLQVPSY